jgi:hypothetical protein
MKPSISLYASSVRPHLWKEFFDSLSGNLVDFEVVFAGNLTYQQVTDARTKIGLGSSIFSNIPFLYIHTANIKPAQAYEIARRHCTKQLVHWTADDAEYSPQALDLIVEDWNALKNDRVIFTVQTIEDLNVVNLDDHRFFGRKYDTPLMAPLGVMSNAFLQALGGTDCRYVSGQYENDIVMRAYNLGASVHKYTRATVSLDHMGKHGGNSGNFRTAYHFDRSILEGSWAPDGREHAFEKHPPFKRYDGCFEPYVFSTEKLLIQNEGPAGIWEGKETETRV